MIKLTPHVHQAVIKAWLEGAQLQYLSASGVWKDIYSPSFSVNVRYRFAEEQHKEQQVNREVMLAWADGHTIQLLDTDSETWDDVYNPTFDPRFTYRVKPETVLQRIGKNYDGKLVQVFSNQPNMHLAVERWVTDWFQYEEQQNT